MSRSHRSSAPAYPGGERRRGYRAATLDRLKQQRRARPGALVDPPPEAIRAALDALSCPWCGAGPFRVPLGHISAAHGIDRFTVRDLGHIPTDQSLTEFEVHETRSEMMKKRGWPAPGVTSAGSKKRPTALFLESQRRKHRAQWDRLTPDERQQHMAQMSSRVQRQRHDVEGACGTCGRLIAGSASRHLKFCSHRCYSISRENREDRGCLQCGSTFRVTVGDPKRFCSPRCVADSLRPGVRTPCVICGTEVRRPPSQAARNSKAVCSPACGREYSRRLHVGKVLSPETRAKISATKRRRVLKAG